MSHMGRKMINRLNKEKEEEEKQMEEDAKQDMWEDSLEYWLLTRGR